MSKTVFVITKLISTGEYQSIPVTYSITNENGNENIVLIHCSVQLPEDKMPDWLSPSSFTIRKVYSPGNPGITVTELSSIHCKNGDTAHFVGDVHAQIRATEKFHNTCTNLFD